MCLSDYGDHDDRRWQEHQDCWPNMDAVLSSSCAAKGHPKSHVDSHHLAAIPSYVSFVVPSLRSLCRPSDRCDTL